MQKRVQQNIFWKSLLVSRENFECVFIHL